MSKCCAASSCCEKADADAVNQEPEVPTPKSAPESTKKLGAEACASELQTVPRRSDSVTFRIHGMDCAGCAANVDKLIRVVSGVVQHETNFAICQLSIVYDATLTSQDKLAAALTSGGFGCTVATNTRAETLASLKRSEESYQFRCLFLQSLLFSLPLFLLTDVIPHFYPYSILEKRLLAGLFLGDVLAFLLTLPLLWVSRRFYQSTFAAIFRARTTNIDTLVTLGITSAWAYSALVILVGIFRSAPKRPETFFETAGELISFILFGRWLESTCAGWTAGTLTSLVQLAPSTATKFTENAEVQVAIEAVKTGDQLVNRPGSQFAADGIVVDGSGEVDESMLTGDQLPILKQPGDLVVAGTINLTGMIRTRVEKVGGDTQLSQIIELMKNAQSSKASLQLLADRIAAYFTPAIIILSLVTFLLWLKLDPSKYVHKRVLDEVAGSRLMLSLKLAIAVVVVSCPCALSVATPAAVMCGIGVGSTEGILIKGAKVFENLNYITDFVFDKTGTLTQGDMSVSLARLTSNYQSHEAELNLWQSIAAAEMGLGSAHPISKALVHHAKSFGENKDIVIKDFKNIPGRGLLCTIASENSCLNSKLLIIGNASLLAECGITVPTNAELLISSEESEGRTQVYFAVDNNSFAGTALIVDEVKEDAKRTIQAIQALGKGTWMLTGDNHSAAQRIASDVGISSSRVFSDQTVAGKADVIKEMQKSGKRVALVGDGINDAPALALADVGFSLTGSTAIAVESADVVLLRPRVLIDVVAAVVLSRDVFRRIKYNLFFAFAWNFIGIPFAMGVLLPVGLYLPPALAGGLMALSCVCIICSSLLLRTWKRPDDLQPQEEKACPNNSKSRALFKQIMLMFRDKTDTAYTVRGEV